MSFIINNPLNSKESKRRADNDNLLRRKRGSESSKKSQGTCKLGSNVKTTSKKAKAWVRAGQRLGKNWGWVGGRGRNVWEPVGSS